jgi:hypothetical protein
LQNMQNWGIVSLAIILSLAIFAASKSRTNPYPRQAQSRQ